MNTTRLVISAATLLTAASLHANAQTPETEFVGQVMQQQEESGFNFWDGLEKRRPGGMLVRGFIDVTGDGVPDLLITSSLDPELQWSLFVAQTGGYRQTSSEVKLQGPSARIRKEGGLTFLTDLAMRSDWLGIFENQIDARGTVRVKHELVDGYDYVKQRRSRPGWPETEFGEGVRFQNAETVSLQEYLQNPAVFWRPYAFEQPLQAQDELIPAETQQRLNARYFSPMDAQQAWARLNPKTAASGASTSTSAGGGGSPSALTAERGPERSQEESLPSPNSDSGQTVAGSLKLAAPELVEGERLAHVWIVAILLAVAGALAAVIKRAS